MDRRSSQPLYLYVFGLTFLGAPDVRSSDVSENPYRLSAEGERSKKPPNEPSVPAEFNDHQAAPLAFGPRPLRGTDVRPCPKVTHIRPTGGNGRGVRSPLE